MRIPVLACLLGLAACDDTSPKNQQTLDLSIVIRDLAITVGGGSSNIGVTDANGAFPAITVTTINCVTSPGFYFSFPLDQLATPLKLTQPIYGGATLDGVGGTVFYISAAGGGGYPYSGDVPNFTVGAAGGTIPKSPLKPDPTAAVQDTIYFQGTFSCQ